MMLPHEYHCSVGSLQGPCSQPIATLNWAGGEVRGQAPVLVWLLDAWKGVIEHLLAGGCGRPVTTIPGAQNVGLSQPD